MKTIYGEHYADKLGRDREKLAQAGITLVDTTYLSRCFGRRPLPETIAEIRKMPMFGGGRRKKKDEEEDEKAEEQKPPEYDLNDYYQGRV